MQRDSQSSAQESEPTHVGPGGSAPIEHFADRLQPPCFDEVALDADLAEAERLVTVWKRKTISDKAAGRSWHLDAPHAAIPTWHSAANTPASISPSTTQVAAPTEPPTNERHPLAVFGSWLLLSFGLMAFACGGMLLAVSVYQGRDDLWRLGLPLALAGQAMLIIGVVLQLDGLWQSNQETARSLDTLDTRMEELRQNAAALSASHSGPATSFYAHLAGGASPHILLSDLKGQLDMLAMRMQK